MAIPDHYDNEDIDDLFYDTFYKKNVIIDGIVYDVEKEDLEYSSIFRSKKLENGDIEFLISYYNGGCSFDEAIHEAIKNSETK